MNRRGFTLLATLWFLALLTTVTGGILTLAQLERGAAINRVAIERGRWAAEACLAIAGALAAAEDPPSRIDPVDLGGGTWCRGEIEDLGGRIPATASFGETLGKLIDEPERAAALLDWVDSDDATRAGGAERDWYRQAGRRDPRNAPLADLEELRLIRGFDSTAVRRVSPFLTTRNAARINANVAPREVLAALPGFDPTSAGLIVDRRARGVRFENLDDLLATLPTSLRVGPLARYGELAGLLVFGPERLELRLEGHVAEAPIIARLTVVAVPIQGRLAVLTREEP